MMNTRNIHWLTLAALCTVLVAYGDNGSLDTVELALENTAGRTVQTSLLPATMDERSQLLLPTHINHRPVSWIVDTDDAPLELVKNEQGQLQLLSKDVVEDTPVELVASDTSRHTLTIKEIDAQKLPPLPDWLLARETVLGIDTNNNGIRDDVEHGLYELYGDRHEWYRTALYGAASRQIILRAGLSESDKEKRMADQLNSDLIACMFQVSEVPGVEIKDMSAAVSTMVYNSIERRSVREKYYQWLKDNVVYSTVNNVDREWCDSNVE